MVVGAVEIPPGHQGILQRRQEHNIEIFSEIRIQRGHSLRRGIRRNGAAVARAVRQVHPHAVCRKAVKLGVGGGYIRVIREGRRCVIHRQSVNRRVIGGIGAVQNIVTVLVVARRVNGISVLVQIGRRDGIAARRHVCAGLQIGAKCRKNAAVLLQIKPCDNVVVSLGHTEEGVVEGVCRAELALGGVKFGREQQQVAGAHLCANQLELRQRIGVGEHTHVHDLIMGQGSIQRGAVIPEPRRGTGEQHKLLRIGQ